MESTVWWKKLVKETSQALTAPTVALKILGPSFELHPTGLTVIGKPTKEEYDQAFSRLSFIESAQSWWYGDLANAREKHYGSLDEMAEGLNINYSSLQNYQWVSNQYKLSTRVDSLSFRHHLIAAPLVDRQGWLEKAEEKGWSTRTLELEIHKAKRQQLLLPSGVYDVIYADPPWQYSNVLWPGAAEDHYPTMSIVELCDLKIPTADNAMLFCGLQRRCRSRLWSWWRHGILNTVLMQYAIRK